MRTSVYQTISRYFFALLFLFIVIGCELDDDDGLDTSILERKIEEAVSLFEDTEISDDGTNVLRDKYWVTQEDYDKFEEAIEKAINALNANAQIEIAKAVSDLHNAINSFNNKETRKTGTRITKDTLENLIEKAEAAKVGINISTHADYVLPEYYWATQGAFNSLNSAITYAEKMIAEATDDADEDYFDDAYTNLEKSLSEFEEKVSTGSDKSSSITALYMKIEETRASTDGVVPADNASEVLAGRFYTDSENLNAINDAIETAKAVIDNNDMLTKSDIDNALTALNNALIKFSESLNEGTGTGIVKYDLTVKSLNAYEDEYVWIGFYSATPEKYINVSYAYRAETEVKDGSVVVEMLNSKFEEWTGTGSYYVLILAGSCTNNFEWEYEKSYISSSKIDFANGRTLDLKSDFEEHRYSFMFDDLAEIAKDIPDVTVIDLDGKTTFDDWFKEVEGMEYEEWCTENSISLFKEYSSDDEYSGDDFIAGKTVYSPIPVEYLFRQFIIEDEEDED